MNTSEQLERETERTREEIAATLDELRARMTPGRVVDQLFDYAQDSSGGLFFQNLRQQVVNNPLPVALVGAGLAWLAVANRNGPVPHKPQAQDAAARSGHTAGAERADQARGAASDATSDLSAKARQAGAGAVDAASSAYDKAKDAASSSYSAASQSVSAAYESAAERTGAAATRVKNAAGSVAETASATYEVAAEQTRRTVEKASQAAAHVGKDISGAGHSVMKFFNEQPLVLAGLGIAIGAAIGAALPATEAEDELMGEKSDALKKQAADVADETLGKGTTVAEDGWQKENPEQGVRARTDAAADRNVKPEQPVPEAAQFAQGATGGGEEATLVPSASGESQGPESERKRHSSGA